MRRLLFTLAVAGVLWLASCSPMRNPPPERAADSELPAAIEEFKNRITNMNDEEVRAAAIAQFGQPTREVGSGMVSPQWDVAGGVLSVSFPSFKLANGKRIYLIQTKNLARESLCQNFELGTVPDPANHGTTYWIGTVQVNLDATYRYVDSGSNLRDRGDQSRNFFVNHPNGHIEVLWSSGIGATSRLETLGEREIAKLRFIADDDKTKLECAVYSSEQERRLSIVAPTFRMSAGWLHFERSS